MLASLVLLDILVTAIIRGDLTIHQWERLRSLLPSREPKIGRSAVDPRRISNGLLWSLRTEAPWDDVPERSRPWYREARDNDREAKRPNASTSGRGWGGVHRHNPTSTVSLEREHNECDRVLVPKSLTSWVKPLSSTFALLSLTPEEEGWEIRIFYGEIAVNLPGR